LNAEAIDYLRHLQPPSKLHGIMPQKFAVFVVYQKLIFGISGFRHSVAETFALLGCYFLSFKM